MKQAGKKQKENLDRHLDDDFEKYHRPTLSRKSGRPEAEAKHKFSHQENKALPRHITLNIS